MTKDFVTTRVKNMLIGTPREIKNNEHRVGLVPSSVRELGQMVIVLWWKPKQGPA